MNTITAFSNTKQQGYILLMSMILLILLTVLAVTSVSLNTSQTRIAANATETTITFEKAEGALNEALALLIKGSYSISDFSQNDNGLYLYTTSGAPIWTTINWSSSAVIKSFQGQTSSQAAYIIEQLPSIIKPGQNMSAPTHVYRVTARAVGTNGNSAVTIQGTLETQH